MVERGPEKAGVGGSIPSLGISFNRNNSDLLVVPRIPVDVSVLGVGE